MDSAGDMSVVPLYATVLPWIDLGYQQTIVEWIVQWNVHFKYIINSKHYALINFS